LEATDSRAAARFERAWESIAGNGSHLACC